MNVNQINGVLEADHLVMSETKGLITDGIATAIDGAALGALGGLAMVGFEILISSPNQIDLTTTTTKKGVRAVSRGVVCGVVIAVATRVAHKILCG